MQLYSHQPLIKMWKDNNSPLLCHGEITLSKIDEMYPTAIPNQTSTISMQISSWVNPLIFIQAVVPKQKYGCVVGRQLYQNWWNLPISNPEPDLYNSNALTKFGENPLIFTEVIIWEKNIDVLWADKIDEICPLTIANLDLYNINAHTKFGENPLTFIQVLIWKRNISCVAGK